MQLIAALRVTFAQLIKPRQVLAMKLTDALRLPFVELVEPCTTWSIALHVPLAQLVEPLHDQVERAASSDFRLPFRGGQAASAASGRTLRGRRATPEIRARMSEAKSATAGRCRP
jgi:hypothetical protein